MIYEFALNFNAVTFAGVPRTVHTPGREALLRVSKPLAADSAGRLLFDAWSAWPADDSMAGGGPPVPGQTWDNRFEVWASNGGDFELIWSAEDEGMSADLYLTAEDAYDAIDALLPITFNGWDAYEIRSSFDPNPSDNRGGISLVVEMGTEAEGRELILQTAEIPITEQWSWLTDIATSYDGSEELIPLKAYPQRTFSGNFVFDTVQDVRNHFALMLKSFDKQFRFPLFQYRSKLKSAVAEDATEIFVNAKRGRFCEDVEVLLIEGDVWEIVVPSTVEADRLVLQTATRNAYSAKAFAMPITKVYTATNASVTRKGVDHSATSSFTFNERLPTLPFVPPLNEAVVDYFDGLPLLDRLALGSDFEQTIMTGLTIIDYTGRVDLIAPWNVGQWAFNLSFKASHLGASEDFDWFVAFADIIQGSANPFLFPTNRADLGVVTPAIPGGTGVTIEGDLYSEYYWEHAAFHRIFIDTKAGRHYAKVTGLGTVGDNDRLVFSPALPAGADWGVDQKVGFLLKLRNDNDKIICNHYGLWTEITMATRTVV